MASVIALIAITPGVSTRRKLGLSRWRGAIGNGRRWLTFRFGLGTFALYPQVVFLGMGAHLSGASGTDMSRNGFDVLLTEELKPLEKAGVFLGGPITRAGFLRFVLVRGTGRRLVGLGIMAHRLLHARVCDRTLRSGHVSQAHQLDAG